ncbi:MAG: hypothetical protein ABW215_04710 [Kibdelosporangium sp.]
MSFELAVWYEPAPITAAAADEKYGALCALDGQPGVVPRPEVAAFYRELVGRYPELENLTDEEAERRSPWAADLGVAVDSVLMSVLWRYSGQMLGVVRELAGRHGLICYDVQEHRVHHPPGLRTEPELTLTLWDGSQIADPAPDRIEKALRMLSRERYYVILQRAAEHYLQVGYGEDVGTRPGWYALERRDGAPDRHYRCEITDLAEIIKAFLVYRVGEKGWERRFGWWPVEF